VQKTYPDLSLETYTFDALGNRLTVTDTRGLTTATYDSRDRLLSETRPDAIAIAYAYDAAGNRTNLTTTVNSANETTTYAFDAVGNQTHQRVGQIDTSYTYDTLNRLTDLSTKNYQLAVVNGYHYTLDPSGHRTQVVDHTGATTTYGYDNLYRLTGETLSGHPVLGTAANSYTYDPVGNRTFSTEQGISRSYTYDANDRLLSAGGDSYTYDANGNTLAKSTATDVTTYSYDANDRLIGMDLASGGLAIQAGGYVYDADGLRIAKTVNGIVTNYLLDKNRDYAQVLKELDAANSPQMSYTYGSDLIKQRQAGMDRFYLYDSLGSTRALASRIGIVTDRYSYDAYGQLIDQTGTTVNDYLFAGEQFDSNLNNYYLRERYYDQSTGRFNTMDTWMGINSNPVTLHKYAYGNLDPINNTDPSGNFGLSSITAANTISAILTTASVVSTGISVFEFASGEREPTAQEIGITALIFMAGPAAGKLIKVLVRKNVNKTISAAISSGALAKILVKNGKVSEVDLRKMIPPGTPNTFTPSKSIKAGFKYNFKIEDIKIEVKWHSPNLRDAKKFPGSNSGSMWTAQIRADGKLLGADGKMHRRAKNATHIPLVF